MTTEELNQIREVIKAETEPINQKLNALETNMVTSQDITSVRQDMQRLEKKLDQSMHDNAVFFNEAGIFFDKITTNIEKRIDIIEDVLGLTERTKN